MTTTTADKKSLLEKLAEQKSAIEAKLKAEKERIQKKERRAKTEENAKKRKEANQEKYAYGGLCELAGLLGTDKGAVLGVLLWAAKAFSETPDKLASFKKSGDSVLAQREADRKKPFVETLR